MKFWCSKENKLVYPHPGLARVADFDFHQCSECTIKECEFSSIRELPYEAFMLVVRWWSQCPVDAVFCTYGWLVGHKFVGCQKEDGRQWKLGRLHYSLPPHLNARVWNRWAQEVDHSRENSSPVAWPWWAHIEGLLFRFVNFPLRRVAKVMLWWKKRLMGKADVLQQKHQGSIIEQRTRLRVVLLKEAIKEAKQRYPSYKTDVPHWKNSKLRQEVEAAGEVYDV